MMPPTQMDNNNDDNNKNVQLVVKWKDSSVPSATITFTTSNSHKQSGQCQSGHNLRSSTSPLLCSKLIIFKYYDKLAPNWMNINPLSRTLLLRSTTTTTSTLTTLLLTLFLCLVTNLWIVSCSSINGPRDPRLIVYPGDVNVALIVSTHKSSKPGSCSDQVNLDQIRGAMTALWSVHQINQARVNSSTSTYGPRLGINIYDTCSDPEIAERQIIRLLGNLDDIQSTSCSKDNREAPLIGVISSGPMLGTSLHLLTSFRVPIITVEEQDPMHSSRSTLYSVASSLKYLSKGVVGLLNKLNWSAATLVVSDEVPLYYTKILEEIALKVRFNVQTAPSDGDQSNNNNNNGQNVHHHSNPSSSNYPSSYAQNMGLTASHINNNNNIPNSNNGRPNHHFNHRSHSASSFSSSQQSQHSSSVKNTILFLSPDESLKLFTSLRSQNPPESNDYEWIVVTSRDIINQLRSLYKSSNNCHSKPMYLILPQQEKVPDLGRFLAKDLPQMGESRDPMFQQLLEMAQSLSNLTTPSQEALPSMIKAIWSYNLALRNYEAKYCDPSDISGHECIRGMGSNLVSMIQNEIQLLNNSIGGHNYQSLNGFRLNFDDEHYLSSNRFALKAITTRCEIIDMGYFEDGILITDDQIKSDTTSQSRTGPSGDDSVGALQSNFISSMPSAEMPEHFESERTKLHWRKHGSNESQNQASNKRINVHTKSLIRNVQSESVIKLRPVPYSGSQAIMRGGGHGGNQSAMVNSILLTQNKSISGRSLDSRSNLPKHLRDSATAKQQIDRLYSQHGDIFRRRFTSFFSWLGWAWTVAIVSVSAIGILVALYTFTYILMKSCEGALKKSNQDLATFHLLSIIIVYFGSVLYIYPPSTMMCSVRSSVHNISLTMLLASLFQRGMYLRAQKWIGLGGKISKLNQCLTLIFVIGIQVALEVQRWGYETPWSHNSMIRMPKECSPKPKEYLSSQAYLMFIMFLLVLVAFSARKQPFAFKDGKHVFITSMILLPIYLISIVLMENFADYFVSTGVNDDVNHMISRREIFPSSPITTAANRNYPHQDTYSNYYSQNFYYASIRDIISSLSMILIASTSLLGIFGPIIYTIHKYGILPPKNGSYAESLSTAFTLFHGLDGSHRDSTFLDHIPGLDSSSDGRSQTPSSGGGGKSKKCLIKSKRHSGHPGFVAENGLMRVGPLGHHQFKPYGLKPGSRERQCPFNHCRNHLNCNYGDTCAHMDKSGLIRNPLYDDKNFRSAYP
ncbi:uncharacterized protein LOC141849823 [Brevipalpus obovatus]|uniref:uncharacterized protein LOC141849823 n=1 Tax=Brevipalpus obovatus TaxID=246614 RepID=UPI003D9F98CF